MGFLRRKYGHKYPCNDARFVPRAVTSFEISNYYNRCRNIFYLLRQQCWRRLNFCAIKIQRSITETEFILKWILKRISWQTRSQVFHLATMRGSFHAALKFRINSRFDHYYNPCYIFLFFYFIRQRVSKKIEFFTTNELLPECWINIKKGLLLFQINSGILYHTFFLFAAKERDYRNVKLIVEIVEKEKEKEMSAIRLLVRLIARLILIGSKFQRSLA